MTTATRGTRGHGMASLLPSHPSPARTGIDAFGVGTSLLFGALVGAFLVSRPVLALAPLAVLGALLLLVDARARIIFFVFGALLTLQSSGDLNLLKLAYLGGIVVAFVGAILSYSQKRDSLIHGRSMPLLRVSIIFFLLLLLSFVIANTNGVPHAVWLRDAAPYFLFASAPIFALDAQASLSQKTLLVVLVTAGMLATLAFAVAWLERREIADLPLARLALSSFFLPAALFSYSLSAVLHTSQTRMRWLATAASIFALLLATGTRTTLALLAAPLAVAIGARRYIAVRSMRLLFLMPIFLAISLLLAYSAIQLTNASTDIIGERISILKATGDRAADASYGDRVEQANAAWSVFKKNVLFGAGPGTHFEWRETNGDKNSSFVLDTPLTFPAKFGIAGLAAIAALVVGYASFLRSAFRVDHPRVETLALAGYAGVTLIASLLAPPFEDKGFSLGLVLLLALVLRTSRMRESGGAWHERSDSSRGA
jgi:O-Antigen ligase